MLTAILISAGIATAVILANARMIAPVAGAFRVSSGFGTRVNPVTGQVGQNHNGIDLAAPEGTPIIAPIAGTVLKRWTDALNGNAVQLEHGGGLTTGFAHMRFPSSQLVGNRVEAGDIIGEVGSTGESTGPHLHFCVFLNGIAQDPSRYLDGSGMPGPGLV